ncbi:Ig-like domain-containing protein [Natronosalvus rutilus]|uniref:Ig-like domain-containing protein n=1 Tax=Natronosalvus rutilus TaxID=2953753 RepID=A0A9E7SWT4_9EURY|nr:Ig-like domain-containing protein [Natronosalvus rutilus]UTF53473.1 Ig-like domain-containing protein [Natronosalvus rutilus]
MIIEQFDRTDLATSQIGRVESTVETVDGNAIFGGNDGEIASLGTSAIVDHVDSVSILDAGDWGTDGRDSGRSGHNPNASGPTTDPDARWVYEFTDDVIDIPVVVAAGHVYVPGEDSLRAIDNDTGEEVWNVSEPSIRSVTATQDVVVTTATSYSDGDWIRGYHATNGTERWNVSNFEADATVAFDGTFYATRGEYLYAYDLQTGEQLWSVDVNEDVTGSLSAAGGMIYATGQVNDRDYAVYALSASDGSEEWRFEMEGELSMQPTVADDSVFVGTGDETYDPKFYKLNATDGHVEWIFDVNTQPRGTAVADGYVYLAAGNTIHALDETTGQREWLHRFAGSIEYGLHYEGMHTRSPAVADGTVYAVNDRGFLVGLDGATGTELWEYRLEGWAMTPAVADDRLYVHVIDTEDTNTDYSRVYALEEPPFQFSDFALSATKVEPGESFTATVNVTNVDDETRTYDSSLMADPPLNADWRAIDRTNGTLAPGESRELTFVGTVYSSGSWDISVKRPLESDPTVDPVTIAVETPVQSDNWPSVGFDSGRTGDNPDTVGPMRNAQEAWNLTYFDDDARPVIANGSVFVVQEQRLYSPSRTVYTLAAYDEATGTLEWEFNVSARDRAAAGSATVDGDTVYLFTRPMNFDGEGPAVHDNSLFALNRSDGTEEWSRDFTLNKTLGTVDQGPVIADGQVYVAGGIPEDSYGDSNASLIAFDADTGATSWDYQVKADRESELFYYATAADGMVVVTLADEDYDSSTGSTYDDRLVVLNAAGGHEWSTSGLMIDVQEPPVIRNGTVYVISEDHQQDGDPIEVLHAFDLSDGTERWSFSPTYRADEANGWRLDSPTVTDDGIFVSQRIDVPTTTSSIGHLYRLDPTSGDVVWNRSTPLLSTQFAVGGLLYAGDADGDYTFVYDAETGETYTETDFYSRGRGTAQVVANGTMITYAESTSANDFRVVREGGLIEYTELTVDSYEIGEGENVTVTATATNHGAYTRNYDVELDVAPDNHGDRHFWNYATRRGTLAPGESTTITWTVRLDVRDDFVFFLVPLNDGDGNEDDDVGAMNLHKYDRAGTQTVHVGDADDGTVFNLGGPRDLEPDVDSWPKESFDAGNTGNYTGTGAPTAVGDDTVFWAVNHSSEWTSGPTLAEDTVFAGGYDGGDEAIYAFNATDGSLRWEYPTERDVEVAPTYAGSYLYTADGSGRVYQFDATTGERLWTYTELRDVGGITVVDDVAYVAGDVYVDGGYSGTLHALNATTREVLWTFTRSSSSYGMGVTPAVENGTVYVTSDDGYIYALDAATGGVEWSEPVAGSGSSLHSPVVEDGVVYVDDTTWDSTDANLYALDATDGSTIWNTPANVDGYTGASPALANDTLFFTADGAVRAVDATVGSTGGDLLWSTQLCSAARYSPVHADGVVYVPTTDSAIRAYDADTGDLVWRYDAYGEHSFTPAVVDGQLYSTGLENDDYTHSLVALAGGTTAEPKSSFEYSGLTVSSTNVSAGESVTVSATVENLGDVDCGYAADLTVDGSVADTATGTISPGYYGRETVEFTHTFSASGTYDVTIADLPPVAVTATEPEPDVEVTPGSWDYGTVDDGEWVQKDFLVKNVGTADLDWSDSVLAGPDADEFSITYDQSDSYVSLSPGNSGWVTVSTAPTTPGTKTATLQIRSDDPDEPRFNVSLTAKVVGEPEVDVSPTGHDFGDVEVGSNATTTVVVSNVGGGPLAFDGAQLTGGDAGAYAVTSGGGATTIGAGDSHAVAVEFAPAATGQADATLELSTDDTDEPTVNVALSGTGTDTVQNRAPIAVDDHYTTFEGQALTVDAPGRLANDFDPEGDDITTTNTGSPDNGTVSGVVDGSFTYTPDPGFTGTDSFRYLIRDEHGAYSSYGTVTVEVVDGNRAPVAVDDHYSVYEGETLTVSAPGRLENDYDPDGDDITTTNTASPGNGTVTGVVDGSFTYTPDPGFVGTDSFQYLMRDEQGAYSSYGTVTVEVLPDPNQAPVAVDDHYSIAKGKNLTVSAPGRLANDYDPDGDDITTTNTGSPSHGTVTGVVDGSFTYRPDPDFAGTDSFDYIIRDEHGTYSSYGTVTVEVVDGNRAPIAVDDHYSIAKGENLTVSAPGRLANDYDPDGDAITTTNTGSPGNGTVTGVVDGSFTYRPDPGFVGTDSFQYLMRDEHGTSSSYGTVTVEVFDTNATAPVAVDDHYTTLEGQALTVDAPGRLANDYDPEGDDITTTNTASPDNGTVSGVVDGSFTYTPDPGFVGTDSFQYLIRDEHGTYSSYGTVTVEVLPDPNQAPIAVDDYYSIAKGENLTIDAPGRLANDYDPDGDDITTTNTGSPTHGTVSGVVDGSFTYIPDPGFVGTDSFDYLIRDEHGAYSSYGTVTVEVVDGNRAPVAVDDHYSMVQGETLTVDAPGRLANDRDPDGDVITTTNTGSPDNGTVTGVVDGSFTYTPDPGFVGTDSFVYLMRDEHGAYSSYGTVTVEVVPDPNRAPVAVPDHYAVLQGGVLDVAAPGRLANDYDLDGDVITTTNTGSPAHGTVSGVVDGSFTYTPDPGFVGVDSFGYLIRDEHGTYSDYSTVTVTVVDASITVGAEISVTPSTLAFGTTPVGSTRTKTITVANVGDRNLTLSDVTLAGPEADAYAITAGNETATLGYGETEVFTVAYAPTELETANATVTIHSDDPGETTVDVSLVGSGYDDDAPTVHAIDVASSSRDGATVYANGTTDIDVSVNVTDTLGSVQYVRIELDARASPARRTETALFDATSGNWTASFDPGAIAADGRYGVSVVAVDDSGNRATVAATDEVIVDRTAPQLAAIVDRVDATSGNVTVDASEPLRDGTLSVVVEQPDGTNETVAMTGSDDAWTGTFALPEDGQYNVTATALDLTGNRATDEATAQFQTGDTDGNNTILLKMVPSGLFVEFTTDQPVTDTFVTMTESTTPLKPLDSDQLGVNFLNAALENRLAGNLSHAVVGIPVDQALLGPGTGVDDVTIRHFDDDNKTWSAVPTTVENVTLPDGTTGDYWVANVTHFSTYGAITTDATPPGVTETNPTDGHEFAAGTASTTLRMEFEDVGTGVDASETVVIFDDTLVTFDDATTITSEYVEYRVTGLVDGSSHELELFVTDAAGNGRTETITFTVATPSGGEDDGTDSDDDDSSSDDGDDNSEDDDRSDGEDLSPGSANIVVTDLEIQPSNVRSGETVTVLVSLENVGDATGDHVAELRVNGTVVFEESVTVSAGGSETVTATHTFEKAGTYTLSAGDQRATLEVSDDETETDEEPDGSDGQDDQGDSSAEDDADDVDDTDGTDDRSNDSDGQDDQSDGRDSADEADGDDRVGEDDRSDDKPNDGSGDEADDTIPGFGISATFAALLVTLLVSSRFVALEKRR